MCSIEEGLKENQPPVYDQCTASIVKPTDEPDTGEEVRKTTSDTSGAPVNNSKAEEVRTLVTESAEAG